MYCFPSMLEMTNVKQPTKAHQKVAIQALIANPRYHTLTALIEGAEIIAKITNNKIKKITIIDLYHLGIMVR